jgi:methionyl-tRNA formyltransferase
VNIVYMGTSAFAVPTLQRLCDAGFTITAAFTQPDKPSGRGQAVHAPPVKQKACELQIPVHQPASLKEEQLRSTLEPMQPDIIVVVAYGKILPVWLLRFPPLGAVNLHGSLLPKYRGAAPIHWAVANGDAKTGVCTMQVDERMDTGPVYLCEEIAIDQNETAPHLSDRLAAIGKELMVRTIQGVVAGTLVAQPQDNDQATYAPILKKSHGFIDWNDSAEKIRNRVRAFNPWPGTVTRFRGKACKILHTKVGETFIPAEPGTIHAARQVLSVTCGDGSVLEILELQPENRKPMSAGDFANGAHIRPGEKFEPMTDNG